MPWRLLVRNGAACSWCSLTLGVPSSSMPAVANKAPGFRKRGKVFHTKQAQQVRSGYERQVCDDLDARRKSWEYEPDSLEIWIPTRGTKCSACSVVGTGLKASTYTVDIRLPNMRYVELKGKLAAKDRTRLKALVDAWGAKFARPISLLLQRDNWLTKAHKRRYTDWARSIGLDVAVGTSIPEGWFE